MTISMSSGQPSCHYPELIVDSINLCEENVDTLHTKWNTTVESTLATVACTGDYTGNASRYCSSHGKWKELNYINCISKSIQHIKEQTAKLLSGDSEYNLVTIILKELENITRDNDDLLSGDLLTSSFILNDIAMYVTNHTEKLSLEQLEIFASLCNNLLDERNRQPWEELVDGGSGGAAPLVNAVTEFNDAFNDVIDIMEVGKTSSDEIIVPDRSKTNVTWISDSGTEIKLKLQKNICTGLTGYSSTFYRNVSRLFPEYLLLNGNTSNGAWSSFGSRLVDAEDSYTICEYNHTTNFAILMSPGGRPLSRAHHFPLSLISAIGCGVSILFLIITIIIHVVFWRDVSDDGTKVLMNLCVALIISYVIFLAGITQTENELYPIVGCLFSDCSCHALYVPHRLRSDAGRGILFVKMVVFIFNKRSIVNQLIPPCWIVPAVIVGISAGVTKLNGYGNHKYCWLSPETNLIWAFIGPALLVITINVIVIIITVYKMMTVKAVAAKTPKEKSSKIGLKGIRVMLPLFGVTWVLGTFSLNDDLVMFQYLFAICNSLQGLFIFVFNCCLTDKIRKGYRENKRRRANRMDLKFSTECTNNDNLKTAHRRKNVYTEEMDDTL
ncbi:unnamed protein product [Mytilus edulis]|uniref:Uncharacterized protein n=1 Tax=Mytilus edulis TaxID=6550 RepID=A0A8S3VHR9_MYTED|nr:unnamed protein product [Mytilus edulis]